MKSNNFRGAFNSRTINWGRCRTVTASSSKTKKFTSTTTASTNKNRLKSISSSTPSSINPSCTKFSLKTLSISVSRTNNLCENSKSRTLWTNKSINTNLSKWFNAILDLKKLVTVSLVRCLTSLRRGMVNTTKNHTISTYRDKWLNRGKIKKSFSLWIKGSTCTTSIKLT